jgi:hypothetical protein
MKNFISKQSHGYTVRLTILKMIPDQMEFVEDYQLSMIIIIIDKILSLLRHSGDLINIELSVSDDFVEDGCIDLYFQFNNSLFVVIINFKKMSIKFHHLLKKDQFLFNRFMFMVQIKEYGFKNLVGFNGDNIDL